MARSDDGGQRGKTAAREGRRCHPMVTRHGQKRQLEGGDDGGDGRGKRQSSDAGREKTPTRTIVDGRDEPPACWICLGEGPNESGEPLRRDCSCRGASGFAHLSCIEEWGRRRAEEWDGEDLVDLCKLWIECNQCRQYFQNEMAVEMATKFVEYTEEYYRDDPSVHLASLDMQLICLSEHNLAGSRYPKILQGRPDANALEVEQNLREEVKQKAETILSVIEGLKEKERSTSMSDEVLVVEGNACDLLGMYYHSKLTEESARRAVKCFEKCLALEKALGGEEFIANMEANVAMAKSVYEGAHKWAGELVEKRRIVYSTRVAAEDEYEADTTVAGIDLAVSLHGGKRTIEAERLSSDLLRTCKQVHGSGNCIVKQAERMLQLCKERYVTIASRSGTQRYQALRYDKNGAQCVVRGPVATPKHTLAVRPFLGPIAADIEDENAKTFTVDSSDIRPTLGTPVVCYGTKAFRGKRGDVRSRDEESGLFNVHFEDPTIDPQPVDHRFMRILFDLPVE